MTLVGGHSSSVIAEVFPVNATGLLSGLSLSLYETRGSDGDLWVEIRSTVNGVPSPLASPPLGTLQIRHKTVPTYETYDHTSTALLHFDLSSLGIQVKQDDVLALVLRPAPGPDHLMHGEYMVKTVLGDIFPDGRMLTRILNNPSDRLAWNRMGNTGRSDNNLVFCAYVDPAADREVKDPVPILPANPLPSPPRGRMVAQALALPESKFIPTPSTQPARSTTRPAMPEVECRGTAFEHDGKWYLEASVFNSSWMARPVPRDPLSITVVRDGTPGCYLVFPRPPSNPPASPYTFYASPYRSGFGESFAEPSQGFVRQYLLRDSTEPLPPGTYRAVIVYPPNMIPKPVEVPFTVPAATAKQPAAGTSN